mgnify:CR=1 FL=1
MSSPILSKKALSKILKNQLEIYNAEHPDDIMSYVILFDRITSFRFKHPIRYSCLGYAFDNEIDEKLITRIDKAYRARKAKAHYKHDSMINKESTSLYLFPDDIDDFNAISNYLNGDYYFEYEFPEYDPQKENNNLDLLYPDKFIVQDANQLYYNLARVVHMDERTLIETFYAGEGLSIIEYDMQYIRDVLDYYLQKAELSQRELTNKIKKKNFGKSNIGNIFKPNACITFNQFTEIASALNIPKHILDACKYRLAQFHDAFATKSVYKIGQEDLYEDLADIGIYDDQIYLYKLFTSLGFSFPDYPIMPSKNADIISYMSADRKLSVVTPDGTKSTISIDNYLDIIDKISLYSKELLEKECSHANNNSQK